MKSPSLLDARRIAAACIFGVVLLTAAAAAAPVSGDISGVVLDAETLEPVAGATVSAGSAGPRVTTGADGRYSFDVETNVETDVATNVSNGADGERAIELRVSADGYQVATQQIAVPAAGITDQIILLYKPEAFGEVIEIIEKAPRRSDAPGHSNLERTELVTMPGTRGDALQVVKALPGVANVDASGAGAGMLVIRGAAPEDSMFLLDGLEIPVAYHFFGAQSVLPSEFIDDIEFMPGGFGVEHGRATGGIVHIHTRPNRSTEWGGFAELSFINAAAYLEGPLSKSRNLHLSAAFRRSVVDALLPAVLPDDADLSFTTAPQYYDGQMRLDWTPGNGHRLSLVGIASYDLMKLFSNAENARDTSVTGNFFNETGFSRLMASWDYGRDSFRSKAAVAIGLGQLQLDVGSDYFLDGTDRTVQGREELRWQVTPRIAVEAGADFHLESGTFASKIPLQSGEGMPDMPVLDDDPLVEIDSDYTDRRAASWLAAEFEPTSALQIVPGVRLDYYDWIGAYTVSPRLNARYDLTPSLRVRGAVGQYSRPLQYEESIPRDLEPERATQYIAGAEYDIAEGIQATASGFYTDRRDLVVQDRSRMTASGDPSEVFLNRGVGSSYGAELWLRMRRDEFFGWVAYTLSRSERIDGPGMGERLFDYDQTHNLVAVASWQWRDWRFGARFQYTTGRPDTPVVGSVFLSDYNAYIPRFGAINSARFAPAHQLDLRVDRKWTFDDWELSAYFDVSNVYAHSRTLGYEYSFDYADRVAYKTLPIFPAFGLRGAF